MSPHRSGAGPNATLVTDMGIPDLVPSRDGKADLSPRQGCHRPQGRGPVLSTVRQDAVAADAGDNPSMVSTR